MHFPFIGDWGEENKFDGRTHVHEWALINKLPNELLVDEGRLTLMGAIRLGLITQFQYEKVVSNRRECF